jgi:hypothetical protein
MTSSVQPEMPMRNLFQSKTKKPPCLLKRMHVSNRDQWGPSCHKVKRVLCFSDFSVINFQFHFNRQNAWKKTLNISMAVHPSFMSTNDVRLWSGFPLYCTKLVGTQFKDGLIVICTLYITIQWQPVRTNWLSKSCTGLVWALFPLWLVLCTWCEIHLKEADFPRLV